MYSIIVFSLLIAAVDAFPASSPQINTAAWSARKSLLTVQGKKWQQGSVVELSDDASGTVLDTVTADKKGRWKLVIANLSSVPCRVHAESGEAIAEKDVKNAPYPCTVQINIATWNARRSLLNVQGKNWEQGTVVVLSDSETGAVLDSVTPDRKGKWKFTISDPSSVPCRVRAESGEAIAEQDVKNAPSTCSAQPPPPQTSTKVFAFNDLGMHCYDKDFSIFAILPLFNVLHAQVVQPGSAGSNPRILDNTQAGVKYSAIADTSGSINTTSRNKTNFWDYVLPLFGVSPPVDEGLLGATMPGPQNTPQTLGMFNAQTKWFAATGIPITSQDDNFQLNSYPLMSVQAFNISSAPISQPINVVIPVSDEMHCSTCHATNGDAAESVTAARYSIAAWSANADPELQYRENILILHDAVNGGNLASSTPVLCSSCHYSPALDLSGAGPQGSQAGRMFFSRAIHSRHGRTLSGNLPDATNPAIIPDAGISTCYYCHPGSVTQCLRGAMGSAGIICQNCHGGLIAIAGVFPLAGNGTRIPWVNEPKCQSCHTGDAVDHQGNSIRLLQAYDPADPAATPTPATNKRFAEQDNTLFKDSVGHGGMACEACHNGPHAIWPVGNPQANDNVAAVQLQGHAGTIIECTTCHADSLQLTVNGPHGMHNVNDSRWNENHRSFYRQNSAACEACHGLALEGTVLSRAAADRQLVGDDNRNVLVTKGTQVSCTLCHENPLNGGD